MLDIDDNFDEEEGAEQDFTEDWTRLKTLLKLTQDFKIEETKDMLKVLRRKAKQVGVNLIDKVM
ncbi:MAG: hypothetical protein ACFFBD_05940, partial [Candidatus Hodarchaeota archaeon]